MVGPFESDLDQTKMAVAILTACIVQTLAGSDPPLKGRFLHHLGKSYQEARDHLGTDCIETLAWTREILQTRDLGSLLAPK